MSSPLPTLCPALCPALCQPSVQPSAQPSAQPHLNVPARCLGARCLGARCLGARCLGERCLGARCLGVRCLGTRSMRRCRGARSHDALRCCEAMRAASTLGRRRLSSTSAELEQIGEVDGEGARRDCSWARADRWCVSNAGARTGSVRQQCRHSHRLRLAAREAEPLCTPRCHGAGRPRGQQPAAQAQTRAQAAGLVHHWLSRYAPRPCDGERLVVDEKASRPWCCKANGGRVSVASDGQQACSMQARGRAAASAHHWL